ncbi:MAG: DUF2490 domain-containing protein [Bacteroidota bacterium]|nr:DUF2490 domain-containing protein [Bacteroidota bacterium]
MPFSIKSQHKTVHTNMLWEGYYNSFPIDKKFSLLSDAQIRTREWSQHWSQMLVRSGLSYKVNEQIAVTGGFAFFKNAQYANKELFLKNEYRPWQEFFYQSKLKKINLTQRLRTEQRFQQQIINDQISKTYQYIFRLRYRFEAQFPLRSNIIAFLVANEIMVNPGHINNTLFFDQNRSFAGINIKMQPNTALQFQYVKIFQWHSTTRVLENQDVIRVNVFQQLSSKKNIKNKKRFV